MPPDVGLCVQLACVWEATARKPGNVHRYRDFADVGYLDFVTSAAAIAPVLAAARGRRVGETVLACVRATRQVTATNTNLGIVLLLAPLAAVPPEEDLPSGVERVLAGLDVDDARLTYEAIRLAKPGGLGTAAEQDVAAEPTATLREVMALAAGRDLVARQYADGYREVFDDCVPALAGGVDRTGSLEGAIILGQLQVMARHPDTLIARKRGVAETAEANRRAARVLTAGWPGTESGRRELADLDAWLRAEGNARNPGTTADLLTAGLFVLLREGGLGLPSRVPWVLRDGG
jgi:triphosphoribosyl-dephospho-CoA synthase